MDPRALFTYRFGHDGERLPITDESLTEAMVNLLRLQATYLSSPTAMSECEEVMTTWSGKMIQREIQNVERNPGMLYISLNDYDVGTFEADDIDGTKLTQEQVESFRQLGFKVKTKQVWDNFSALQEAMDADPKLGREVYETLKNHPRLGPMGVIQHRFIAPQNPGNLNSDELDSAKGEDPKA